MTLKEKFSNVQDAYHDRSDDCVIVAEDFAIEFADWMISKAERYNSYLCLIKDYKELLEIYKKTL